MATSSTDRKTLLKVKTALDSYNNAQAYYDTLISQYQYVHPQITVTHDATKGRGLKAAKDIPAGTVLISNPSGYRADLANGMTHHQANLSLGLNLFERLTSFGFNLEPLALPNDTLGLLSDFEQPDFSVGTRGENAVNEYPLKEVFPVLPEYLCPNLSTLDKLPNPFLYVDGKGETQHVKLSVNPNIPIELRSNLINAMQDQKKGYPLLMRSVLMAQENSVLMPYNIPFLLPHMVIKPKPMNEQTKKEANTITQKNKPQVNKSTPKVLAGRKGNTLVVPQKAPVAAPVKKEEKPEEKEEEGPVKYNFFAQLMEDNDLVDNLPATMLRKCAQLIIGENDEDDEDEDDEDEDDEEYTAQAKINSKVQQANDKRNGKASSEDDESSGMESHDSIVIFPSFSLINHDCSPNSTPLFFHIPTDDFLGKLYKEHREALKDSGEDTSPQPLSFNLPREASLAACAVVVALKDIKAGEELSINYTPLAHCETSPHLTRDRSPVIQYIPWMQEFRQSQMQRVHSMLCKCKTCQTDVILQKAVGTENAVISRAEKIEKGDKSTLNIDQKTREENYKAMEEVLDAQKPLEPFVELIDEDLKGQLMVQDINTVAQRLILHTAVLSDKQSTFNRGILPMFLFHNREDGGIKSVEESGVPKTPDDIIARLHTLTEHPLWKGIFQSRGGWENVDSSTPFLTVLEMFASSRALLEQVGTAIKTGRADKSKVVVKDSDDEVSELKDKDLIPIIIPQGFEVATTIVKDSAAPAAIIPSKHATLIPTIASLDVTSSLSSSIGIYAAVSAAFERINAEGLPDLTEKEEEEEVEKIAKPSSNAPETDLLLDGTVQPAGTAAEEEAKAMKVKTRGLINASDGTTITPDPELLKLIRESQTYREMAQMLEAILCEVLGLNESEGRKEYILPTHWFVPSVLGVLHPLYIKLGAHTEALLASLFLALITGLSVPLTDIKAIAPVKEIAVRTPKDMRDAKKINNFFTYLQSVNPIPGTSVKPLHSTLVSLFIYMSDALEQILRDCEIAIQYSNHMIAQFVAKKDEEQTDEDKAALEKYKKEFEFAVAFNQAIWFLGQSIEGYLA